MSMVKTFLQQIVEIKKSCYPNFTTKYCGFEDLILTNGRFFEPTPLPKGLPKGEIKDCFRNAFLLAHEHDLTYVEGYARGIIPVHHAWNVDKNGKVVDNTWCGTDSKPSLRRNPVLGEEYFGVALNLEFVTAFLNNQILRSFW